MKMSDGRLMSDVSTTRVRRRVIVTGAAWAVPAIALAVATPAYASSGAVLAFDRGTYDGTGCSAISGARVTATNGGVVTAGASLTVSLSGGYSFAGGATSFTGVTDSSGVVTVPDIAVPFAGGTATISATSAGIGSTSATLTSVAAPVGGFLRDGTEGYAFGVPAGSTPVAALLYLSADGRLILPDGSTITSNVASVGQIYYYQPLSAWFLAVKKTDGSFTILQNGVENPAVGVPAGSRPIAAGFFLTPDGRLITDDGTVIVSNVASPGELYSYTPAGGSSWMLPYERTDGSFAYVQDGVENTATGVPAGSTPLSAAIFLTSDGRVIDAYGNTAATNVTSAGGIYYDPITDAWYLPLKKTDGTFSYLQNGFEVPASGVPSGSTPVSYRLYLTASGDLVDDTGTVKAPNVASTGRIYWDPNTSAWYLPFVVNRSAC